MFVMEEIRWMKLMWILKFEHLLKVYSSDRFAINLFSFNIGLEYANFQLAMLFLSQVYDENALMEICLCFCYNDKFSKLPRLCK